jgi:hypothetical protein
MPAALQASLFGGQRCTVQEVKKHKPVGITSVQEVVVSRLERKLVRGLFVLLPRLVRQAIHLVVEEDVLEVVERASPELVILDGLLDPLLVCVAIIWLELER